MLGCELRIGLVDQFSDLCAIDIVHNVSPGSKRNPKPGNEWEKIGCKDGNKIERSERKVNTIGISLTVCKKLEYTVVKLSLLLG